MLIHRHISCRLGNLHRCKSCKSVLWVITVVTAILCSHPLVTHTPPPSTACLVNYCCNHKNKQRGFTFLKSQKFSLPASLNGLNKEMFHKTEASGQKHLTGIQAYNQYNFLIELVTYHILQGNVKISLLLL